MFGKIFLFTQATDIATHRREGQIRVQLWHGQGIKSRALFTHDEYRYEYMTVMSEKYGDMHAEIFGLRKDQILVTGNPKQDWLYHPLIKGYLKYWKFQRQINMFSGFRQCGILKQNHLVIKQYIQIQD